MSLTVFAHSPTKFLSQESNNVHTVWNVGKLYIPSGFIVWNGRLCKARLPELRAT